MVLLFLFDILFLLLVWVEVIFYCLGFLKFCNYLEIILKVGFGEFKLGLYNWGVRGILSLIFIFYKVYT